MASSFSCPSTLRYEIMNFQHVEPGVYDYINIGSWHEGMLSLDDEMFQMNSSDMVRSVCSEPCSKGEIKVRDSTLIRCDETLQLLEIQHTFSLKILRNAAEKKHRVLL